MFNVPTTTAGFTKPEQTSGNLSCRLHPQDCRHAREIARPKDKVMSCCKSRDPLYPFVQYVRRTSTLCPHSPFLAGFIVHHIRSFLLWMRLLANRPTVCRSLQARGTFSKCRRLSLYRCFYVARYLVSVLLV